MAPNYANTNLYELRTLTEGYDHLVYRGKTTRDISKRLWEHNHDYQNYLNGTRHYCSSFEIVKHGNVKIELVRVANCKNKKHSNRVEGDFIREVECVNKNMPGRTDAECAKMWRAANQKYCKEKEAKTSVCECGMTVTTKYMNGHKQTKKHQKMMENTYNTDCVSCECGVFISRNHLNRHRNTWRHIHDFIHL